MKCKIEIEVEYESYAHLTEILHVFSEIIASTHDPAEIKRVTATCYDSDDKPFMTETPIGSTPQ